MEGVIIMIGFLTAIAAVTAIEYFTAGATLATTVYIVTKQKDDN